MLVWLYVVDVIEMSVRHRCYRAACLLKLPATLSNKFTTEPRQTDWHIYWAKSAQVNKVESSAIYTIILLKYVCQS